MGSIRWTQEEEDAFWRRAATRPLQPCSAAELRRKFAEVRPLAAAGRLDAILRVRLVAAEIVMAKRKLVAPGGRRRPSPAGQLMAEIDGFFDAHRYRLFDWPSTWGSGGAGTAVERNPDSPLSRAGYRVGLKGLGEPRRREILRDILFENGASPVFGAEGENEWGEPDSPLRLYRLACLMAGLVRAAQERRAPPAAAISDWRDDLRWLRASFYDGRYDAWRWPLAEP